MTDLKQSSGVKYFSGAAAWVLMAAAGLTTPAFAQETVTVEAPADENGEDGEESLELDRVVVSGFRQSQENAINNKRSANAVIESITAEDIGRLPDISIAEALARLPGITSQRTNGQSSAINIRGLSQSLTFSTLNGREQVTPNGNRSIEFEQFPSELISGADVFKSPTAELIEGGLAGTVALKTVRPLDRTERTVALNVRGSFNDRADEIFDTSSGGYRLSGSYIDQFADGTLGVVIGYARLTQPDVSTRFVGFDYDNFAPNDFDGDGFNDVVSFGFELEEQGGRDVRDAVIGTVQWQPTDNFNFEFDGYYSRFESTGFGRGIRVIGPQAVNFGNPNNLLTGPITVGPADPSADGATGALIGGTFTRNVGAPTVDGGGFGLTAFGINDNQFDLDELVSIGTKAEYTVGSLTFSGDFTYSSAESSFANEVSQNFAFESFDGGVPGVTFNSPDTPVISDDLSVFIQLNGVDLPTVDISQDFTDRSVVALGRFGSFPFENDDELFAFAGDVEWDVNFGPISSIKAGFRYSEREATQFRESIDFGNDAGFFQFGENLLPPIALTEENSEIECFSGAFADAGFPCFLVVEDPASLVEGAGLEIVLDQDQEFTRQQSFQINEDVIAGYIQANIDTQIGPFPVRGNFGLRVVNTDQASLNQFTNEEFGIGFEGATYTNFLPSANIVIELNERNLIRLSGSRAISRAPITQLGSNLTVSFDSGSNMLTGGGSGNPALEPFLANQGDIAWEHYFSNGGIFTIAGFYKQLETFIASEQDENFDFVDLLGFLSDVDAAQFAASGAGTVGTFNGPVNGEGGFVRGFEMAYSQPFDFLPAPFDGLGAILNYSFTDSEIDFIASNSGSPLQLPLPGLSRHVVNGTLYYEKGGFSNRLAVRFRSEFISPQIGIDQQLPFTNSETVLDYQASYDFPEDGPLDGLTILFQANNLTDEPVRTFFGQEAQTGTLQFFGRQFFVGLSYTF